MSTATTHWRPSHLLLLLGLALVCYWPLSLGVFSAKNDNITAFLPLRFNIVEALRAGHLPLWTPYMFLGFPLHADMQSGAWNPLVWLLALFGRYTLTSLHAEILVYVFLAGTGMYRLLALCKLSSEVRLAGAASYLLCGFVTDVAGSNLLFLAAAAYVPFVLAYWGTLLQRPGPQPALKLALAGSLLFVSAYPAFLILTAYVLLAMLLAQLLRLKGRLPSRFFGAAALAALCFLLLCLPAILSYVRLLPFYQRGGSITLGRALQNSMHPGTYLSIFFPALPLREPAFAATDLISRNAYFNLLLLPFLWVSLRRRSGILPWLSLAGALFFFLFSLGEATPVRAACYRLLPLMNTFRHPANARLFFIIALLPSLCTGLQLLMEGRANLRLLRTAAGGMLVIVAGFTVYAGFNSNLREAFAAAATGDLRDRIKILLDQLDAPDLLLLNGCAQLLFLLLLFFGLRRRVPGRGILLLLICNAVMMAQLVLPFTIASRLPPQSINALIRRTPPGFPAPGPGPLSAFLPEALAYREAIGNYNFFNKTVTLTQEVYTPTLLSAIDSVYADKALYRDVLDHPVAYTTPSGTAAVSTVEWSPQAFTFRVTTAVPVRFELQQSALPGWEAVLDGKPVPILRSRIAFMAVDLPAGEHVLGFAYRPPLVEAAFWLSLITAGLIFISFLAANRTAWAYVRRK